MNDAPPDSGDEQPDKRAAIDRLRKAIDAIESITTNAPPPKTNEPPPEPAARRPTQAPAITYPGMPEGDDWLHNVPDRYRHGERGFDRRIMEALAAVGVRAYTLDDLSNRVSTIPQGVPIFIDWLAHLEERIPGPETDHRRAIRAGLIRNLNDPAARGNQQAVELLIAQLHRKPPVPRPLPEYACSALSTIATEKNFPEIARLLETPLENGPRAWLVGYLGKVKTTEARDIAVRYLDAPFTIVAIKALTRMKAAGVRHLIAPYVMDVDADVRKVAKRAMERLPE